MPTINGTPGDDTLDGTNGPDTIEGLAGNDVISGLGGDDTINGGDGHDTLYAGVISPSWNITSDPNFYTRPLLDTGSEHDTLNGGAGNDQIFAGYGDTVDGGANLPVQDLLYGDWLAISFLAAPAGVNFNIRLATQTIGGANISGIEAVGWLQGSNFDDVLDLRLEEPNANTANNVIEGMGGNDQIFAGHDTLRLDGGDGNDTIDGRASARLEVVNGDAGNDTLYASGVAEAYGGLGDDTIFGMRYSDGGDGNDTIIIVGASLPRAFGGAGNDVIASPVDAMTDDFIAGGSGADIINGYGGDDWIGSAGFQGSNHFTQVPANDLGPEHDELWGGVGNDRIWAGYGDQVSGGDGTDLLHYSLTGFGAGIVFSTTGMTSQNGTTIGGGQIFQVEGVAELLATDFNDDLTLTFQSMLMTVDAAAGDDVIRASTMVYAYGGDGNDRFIGGTFGSTFDGGAGSDSVDFSNHNFAFITLPDPGQPGTSGAPVSFISIENLIGSGGNDQLTGNNQANQLLGAGGDDTLTGGLGLDSLTGGNGLDTFRDTAAGLNGDTIVDFAAGDKVSISDATLAGFAFSLSGNVLSFTGGSITLTSLPAGLLVATYAEGGGVQIGLEASTAIENDYNGDGRSDILWRNTDGTIGFWQGNADATFSSVATSVNVVSTYWQIAGTGDFNADGRDDILWRGANGEVGDWLGNSSGGFNYNAAAGVTTISNDWQIEGSGDFNGDARDDILWRHTNGTVGTWTSTAAGAFTSNANAYGVTADWQIVGVGDFNGDNRDDILWRHDSGTVGFWYGNSFANSGEFVASANLAASPSDWHVIGTGDFNGDGRDDILWRHDSGTVANWLGSGGTFTPNFASLVTISNDWNIAAVGDYNGDGRDDILWRHDSGTIANWLADASGNGTFAPNNPSLTGIGNEWHVQSPDILFL